MALVAWGGHGGLGLDLDLVGPASWDSRPTIPTTGWPRRPTLPGQQRGDLA